MKLDVKDVEKIAHLARIFITSREKKIYAEQLSVVFDYIESLNEVNTDGIIETTQVTGLEDVVREDRFVVCDKTIYNKLMNEFPEKNNTLLKVKAVFEE